MARFALKAPLIGPIVTSTEASRFLHALAALLDNGVSVVNALDIARRATSNPVVASEIERSARVFASVNGWAIRWQVQKSSRRWPDSSPPSANVRAASPRCSAMAAASWKRPRSAT